MTLLSVNVGTLHKHTRTSKAVETLQLMWRKRVQAQNKPNQQTLTNSSTQPFVLFFYATISPIHTGRATRYRYSRSTFVHSHIAEAKHGTSDCSGVPWCCEDSGASPSLAIHLPALSLRHAVRSWIGTGLPSCLSRSGGSIAADVGHITTPAAAGHTSVPKERTQVTAHTSSSVRSQDDRQMS